MKKELAQHFVIMDMNDGVTSQRRREILEIRNNFHKKICNL